MPVNVTPSTPQRYPVAGCNALADMESAALNERAQIEGESDAQIEARYRKISDALASQQSARAEVVKKIEDALGSNGATMLRLSRIAVVSSADLFLAIAVQTKNPQLIAAATGIDMVVDTADFVIQIVNAHGGAQQEKAFVAYVEDRWTTIHTLVSGPGSTYTTKQFAVAQALTETMVTLGEAVVDEVALRQKLQDAKAALEEIETQVAGLPANIGQTRTMLKDQLDAEIFVLGLLQSEYSGTDCRIDGVIGPA